MIANGAPFYPSPYATAPFPNLANHFFSLRPPTISSYYHPNNTPVRKAQPTPPKNPINPPKVPSFKLYDLDTSKQNDLIRFIFNFAGVPLKEKKMKGEEWEKTKSEFQLDQLPILRVNHQLKIYYLDPILRYLAREFHLYGTGEHDHLIIDTVLESIRSFHHQLIEQPSDDGLRQWLTTDGVNHLKRLENLHHVFNRHPPFYLGSHVSIADLIIYFILESLIKVQADLLQSYPHLKQSFRRLEKHPQMANHLRTKPKEHQKPPEKPRQEPQSPTPTQTRHRHRSTSKQHRHRSTSKQNHHHHHHHHHRHQSKEPTINVQNKQTSTSPSIQVSNVQTAPLPPPPPPPPPAIPTVAPPVLPEIRVEQA